jgi:hypothetical protein
MNDNPVEREYDLDGHIVKAVIDYDKETIRLRSKDFDSLYTFASYLKFPGNMEEFVKEKVFPHGYR